MAVIDSIRNFVSSILNRSRPFQVNVSGPLTVGNPEVFTSINSRNAIKEGFNGNSSVYSVVSRDARKFAAVPVYLEKVGSEDGERLENELSKLLDRPNEYQGGDNFREMLRAYYKVSGEAFVWLNRGALAEGKDGKARLKMPVFEMYVLPSDLVTIVPDPSNVWGVLGYRLDVGGQYMAIDKADVIHWKNASLEFDPVTRRHLRGMSPLEPGYKALEANNSATNAEVRMYQNDGAKGVLYNEDHTGLGPEQKKQIDGVIGRKINNNDIKGAVATIPGKWGYHDLGKGSTDLDLLKGKEYSMKELCFLFDVPFEFFDSQTTFANKEQAQKGWLYNTIMPACKQWDSECNRVLLQAFGLEGTAKICSDFDDLPELREDVVQLVTSLNAAWWLTGNEKREWMGFDPINDTVMDEPLLPSGANPLSTQSMDAVANQLNQQGLND